jgi:hypothetical protein
LGGLLSYLVGEGRANEHTEPHLVYGDSATFTMYGDGELDRATALAIAADVDEPRTALGVEVNGGHAWHCSLAITPEDGQLSAPSGRRSRRTSSIRWVSAPPAARPTAGGSPSGTVCPRPATTTSTSP